MPQDPLPAKLVLYGRDQNRDRFRRDYAFRNPSADNGEGSECWIYASASADLVAPLYQNSATIANGVSRKTATGDDLVDWARRMGTDKLPATGASGAVQISASAGGTFIQQDDEITYQGKRYHLTASGLYSDQAQVSIIGTDTGPSTNLPAGTVMTWTAPRPGCGPTAVVVQQADGTGLSGGRFQESDAELGQRLDYIAANPAASGNDAQYQLLVTKTPGISIQQAFTYPAMLGPGSKVICFTLRPATSGGNRIPNATQIAVVAAYLAGQMPGDDGIFTCTIIANPITVNLKVLWAQGGAGWVDAQPWPPYSSPQVTVDGSQTIEPTRFYVTPNTGVAPSVGQSVGVFDAAAGVFRKKKILSVVTSGIRWILTMDTTNGASDTGYAPLGGQVICPWSDSLDDVVAPIVSYFDTLGPGEQLASFFDPGLRQRRSPINPQFWPSSITNRLIEGVFKRPTVQDVTLVDPSAIPYAAPVGSPGVSSYLTTLGSLAVFSE